MRAVIIILSVLFSAAAFGVTALTLSIPDRDPGDGEPEGAGRAVMQPPLPQGTAGSTPPGQNEGGEVSPHPLRNVDGLTGEEGDSGSEETLQLLREEQAAYWGLVSGPVQNITAPEDQMEQVDRDHEIERLREEQSAHGEEMRLLREELARLKEEMEDQAEEERVAAAPEVPVKNPDPFEPPPPEEEAAAAGADPSSSLFRVVERMEGKGRVIAIIGGGAFPSGKEAAPESLKQDIRSLLPEIVVNADALIVVEGHADSAPTSFGRWGKFDGNMALSLKRAEHVALLLEEEGIDAARIALSPFGDTRPLAPNSTADGRAENRRVEIRLVPGGQEERD
jgi:flagellar motor protein MotB